MEMNTTDVTHVTTLEEEMMLIQEGERDYQLNGAMSIQKAYARGLEFINNLK